MKSFSGHLITRGKTCNFYVRRRIPTALLAANLPGKTEIIRSLRTSDKAEATKRLRIEQVRIDAEFAEHALLQKHGHHYYAFLVANWCCSWVKYCSYSGFILSVCSIRQILRIFRQNKKWDRSDNSRHCGSNSAANSREPMKNDNIMSDKIDESRRRMPVGGAGTLAAAGVFGVGTFGKADAAPAPAPGSLNYLQLIPAQGYAFFDYSGGLKPFSFQRRAVGADDVAIEIQYCGACHSDIHTGLGHWDEQQLIPQVTGHEITGIVTAVGKNVIKQRLATVSVWAVWWIPAATALSAAMALSNIAKHRTAPCTPTATRLRKFKTPAATLRAATQTAS